MKWFVVLFAALLAGVVVNGVRSTAYSQDHASLVNQIQVLKNQRDVLNTEWTQLLLEQKTLVNDRAIEKAIAGGLKLHTPEAKKVVYLD